MSITTMEQFEGLAAGATVRVDDHVWTRTEEGQWSRDGMVITANHFRGAIMAGLVTQFDSSAPAVGEVWEHTRGTNTPSGYVRFIVEADSTSSIGLQFHNQQFNSIASRCTVADMQRNWRRVAESDMSPWLQAMSTFAAQFYERDKALTELRAASTVDMAAFTTSLHEAAESLGEHSPALDQVLLNYGMPRERDVKIRVQVDGYFQPTPEQVAQFVPDWIDKETSTVVTVGVNVVRFNVETTQRGTGCMCSTLSRAAVTALLNGAEGLRDFGYTTTCDMHYS